MTAASASGPSEGPLQYLEKTRVQWLDSIAEDVAVSDDGCISSGSCQVDLIAISHSHSSGSCI